MAVKFSPLWGGERQLLKSAQKCYLAAKERIEKLSLALKWLEPFQSWI